MGDIRCWLQDSLERVYPGSEARGNAPLDLLAARNERISFQACVHNSGITAREVQVSVGGSCDLGITIRRVGYVPMSHRTTDVEDAETEGVGWIPGFVPDPLFHEQIVRLGPAETHSFWVNIDVPVEATPGRRELLITFTSGEETVGEAIVRVGVSSLAVQPKRNFPVTHWFYADALCDWYHCEPFDEKFWGIVEPYIADLVAHGNDCVYVPIFTPPTDGVKRPTQLLQVSMPSPGRYEFCFDNVRRWTRLAQRLGARYFEWTHLFTQWGVKHAIRIYRDNKDPNSMFWPPETGATSEVYRNFLSEFLPAFHEFLVSENLLDSSIFHLSDEPHGEEHLVNYRAARALLRELAPWMKVSDALSELQYGKEGLTDNPIPSIGAAKAYSEAGIPAWTYFCCGPRGKYLNRFMDTPLTKIRMSGWLFYKLGARGFLHWGYNYWYKSQTQEMIDPFTEQAGTVWPLFAHGDPFVVYPGEKGPLDSIRWEVFAESLQDYALLQSAGVEPGDALLQDLIDYDDFPKYADWVRAARAKLLSASETD